MIWGLDGGTNPPVRTPNLFRQEAPIAQLDRAQAYEAWGRTFESYWARQGVSKPPNGREAPRPWAFPFDVRRG